MPKIRLSAVTADNWEDVLDLELAPEQEENLPDNATSLVEAQFSLQMTPRAIYAGKKVVGFLMYERQIEEGAPQDYALLRMMIDRRRQGRGFGRAALSLALKEMRVNPQLRRVLTYYWPSNAVARDFYASFGFREIGLDADGEMIAEWRPPAP